MKELGALFGVTGHVVGKSLKEIGLRTAGGKPSRKAFNAASVPHWTRDGEKDCWAWERTKTEEVPEQSGLT